MDQPTTHSLIERWADWDRFPGAQPFGRPEVEAVLSGLDRQSLVEVRGCRGVGKTTILRLVAERLVQRGWKREQILFIDLEDPVWAPNASTHEVDRLVDQAGKVRAVLLDGVERLPGWADWARERRSRHRQGVVAARTGPVGGAFPAGVAGLNCVPLSFGRWIKIFTDKKVDSSSAQALLPGYLKSGGLPVTRKAEGRAQALLELFFSALMKDVVLLRPVRNTNVLTALSVYAISRSGQPISASRLKGEMTRSVDQARMFLDHLAAAGLITLVKRLEDAQRSSQAARLCFAADTGLAWALGSRMPSGLPPDVDRVDPDLALTSVFHHYLRTDRTCWAWRRAGRHGLALGEPERPELLVDVQADPDRGIDLDPLAAVMEQTGCAQGLVLTPDGSQAADPALAGAGVIETRSLGAFLLNEELTTKSVNLKITDKKVDPYSGSLPPHLL